MSKVKGGIDIKENNEMQNKISIVIPVYNTDVKFLQKSIDSVRNQTYKNWELILIDDGSTLKETISFCQNAAMKNSNILLSTQENRGESAARKAGLDKAKGKYLLFLDSDDCLHHQACEYMLQKMEQGNYDLVEVKGKEVENIDNINEDESQPYTEKIVEGNNNLLDSLVNSAGQPMSWSAWGKLYLTKMMRQCYRVHADIYIGADVVMMAEYLIHAKRAFVSDRTLYYYNKGNTSSVTAQKGNIKKISKYRFGEELLKIYQKYGSEIAYQQSKAIYCELLFGALLECDYYKFEGYKPLMKILREKLIKFRNEVTINPYIHNKWKIKIAIVCPWVFTINKQIFKR